MRVADDTRDAEAEADADIGARLLSGGGRHTDSALIPRHQAANHYALSFPHVYCGCDSRREMASFRWVAATAALAVGVLAQPGIITTVAGAD